MKVINKFIDIHCHILPCVDDGSSSVQMTKNMLKIANDEGISTIIATPHFRLGMFENSDNVKKISELVDTLAQSVAPDMKVYIGNEIYFTEDFSWYLENGSIKTLNKSRYVLVEFPLYDTQRHIKDSLYRFVLEGYTPILAHIERYGSLAESVATAEELIKFGAYIQVNADSIVGSTITREKNFAKELLKENLVHFIATDAHSDVHRAPRMREAYEYVCKKFGKDYATEIFIGNQRRVILDKEI